MRVKLCEGKILNVHYLFHHMRRIRRHWTKRNLILVERSKRLAEKVKTKWLHEGEKSNKYFLNMLHAKRSKTDIDYLNTGRGEVGMMWFIWWCVRTEIGFGLGLL